MYIYIYIYIYIYNHENNVPSRFHHHNGFVAAHALGHHASSLYIIIITQASCTVRHVPMCVSCHKVIVITTRMSYCFDDYIYITPILLL